MGTSNSERSKALAGQLRLSAAWCFIGPAQFGLELAKAMWRPRDELFYPLGLILWGFFCLLVLYRTLVGLNQVSYNVPLAIANDKKKEARSVMPYIVGIALVSFCFAMSLVATKLFGRLWAVAAVALGVVVGLMAFITARKIKRFARDFYPATDESRLKLLLG